MPKREIYGYDLSYTDECLSSMYEERLSPVEFRTNSLKTYEIFDGYVLPFKSPGCVRTISYLGLGGISDKDGNMYSEAALQRNRVSLGYEFDSDKAKYDDREVIFAGIFWSHWGHFILELVSRLYYFLEEKNPELPIIYISNEPLSGNFLEFFELLGIDTSRLIWVNEVTCFRKIIVPEVSMVAQEYFTREYRKIYEVVTSKVEPLGKEYEKVFYTTRNFKRSPDKDWGEIKEIEDFFKKNGYKIIAPELKSLREQIGIMKSCKHFAAISGTLPHNVLFANKDINVYILNKSYIGNYQQSLIDSVCGIKSVFIDAHLSFVPSYIGMGPFYLRVSDNLIKFAKDNNMELPENNGDKYFKDFIFHYSEKYRYLSKLIEFDKSFKKYRNYYLSKINGHCWLKLYIKLELYRYFHIYAKLFKTFCILRSY